ncbi:MAG TPA: hypothetical protein VGD56_16680 [Gemmatirosa sp.]
MSDRDWDRELADLDRRLASVPDTPAPGAAATPALPASDVARRGAVPAPPAGPPAAPTTARALGVPAPAGRRSWRAQFALLLRIALGIAVVAALIYWPYTSRCGLELSYYLGLVAILGIVGLITSTSAWRHRAAFVHLLGLAMLGGAITLAAREVLPKVGYAIPSLAHPATWSCAP